MKVNNCTFTGPVPDDGNGWGYQIDGFLSYRVTDAFRVGLDGPLLAHAGYPLFGR